MHKIEGMQYLPTQPKEIETMPIIIRPERGEFGPTYREHGAVEGRLRQLETLSGERDKLVIEDDLTGDKIACYFCDAEIERQARNAWKRRVSVSGEITVNRASGNPASVLVEDIRVLRERADLPQMEDLYGIDITHGVESSKYIEGIRCAWSHCYPRANE